MAGLEKGGAAALPVPWCRFDVFVCMRRVVVVEGVVRAGGEGAGARDTRIDAEVWFEWVDEWCAYTALLNYMRGTAFEKYFAAYLFLMKRRRGPGG